MSEPRIEVESEAVEIDFADVFGACEWCSAPLTFLEEGLGVCESCAWEIDAWRLAEGSTKEGKP